MKEIKTIFFKLRLTPTEKKQLEEYADSRNITMTEAIKNCCKTIFKKES